MKKTETNKVETVKPGKLGKIEIRKLDKIETTSVNSNPSG
ncbi:hypothetical protein CryarDRAFT_2239 [Cryptosporangium arvum DSM 44712]|uniref:Uncharacterized protein n=1 Tax=Cryptosporangium arvum DSM 44712 TaxID=927661 RepID=A0A010ZR38_9ACTN|nr:hypothetical protein CryarDRAFT_2239 [Cryptosporangium arvum DSM 44712]